MNELMLGDYGLPVIFPVTRNGVPYDLSGHTVTLIFTKPSGAIVGKTGSGAGHIASYTIDEGLVDERGWWTVTMAVSKEGLRLHGQRRFRVI